MKEKVIQQEFSRRNRVRGVFELKLCKGTSLPFSALAEHQERALINASGDDGSYHKLSDFSLDQKPWDCQNISNFPAYVVVCFYEPRKKKMVYYIPIEEWMKKKNSGERKSVTEEMCALMSRRRFNYNEK